MRLSTALPFIFAALAPPAAAQEPGELVVPAVRGGASSGATLTLRYVRYPSTAEAPGPPIVFLAGGPGDAGTRALRGMPPGVLGELRAIADVIAFNQRGTGTSEPLRPFCSPPAPDTAPHAAVEACLADAARRGIAVLGLTTEESADDVASLRRALGAPSLQLLAGSYGTHLALAVVRRHPTAVSAIVLVGVEGPDHTFKLPSAGDTVLARIAAARRPTLLDEVRTLRRRLAAEPALVAAPGGDTTLLGERDLQRWIAESLDSAREIDAIIASMPALLEGDYTALARWTLGQRVPRPINLMNLAMDCASWASPERLARIRPEVESSLLGNVLNEPKLGLCEVAGLPRLGDDFRAPLRSNVRALLVAGTFDGRTPVSNALEIAEGMPNAEVMVVEEASHDLFRYPEVMRRAMEFFRAAHHK